MNEKEFPHKAQSRLDVGHAKETRERVEKGMKPAAMTPLTGSGEDRGLKPTPMTPAPKPAQPVNRPSHPKK